MHGQSSEAIDGNRSGSAASAPLAAFRAGLGQLAGSLLMAILFASVIVPAGLVMRALGRDPLRLRLQPGTDSYWVARESPGPLPTTMNRQF